MPVVIAKARNDVFRAPKPIREATLRPCGFIRWVLGTTLDHLGDMSLRRLSFGLQHVAG